MIKHVIFDFDGTIVDSIDLSIELFNELADKYKFNRILNNQLDYLRNLSFVERCRAVKVPLYRIPLLGIEITRNYRKIVGELRIFEGIYDVIHRLKEQGLELSIISSNSGENIKAFLKENGIDVFNGVYCSRNLFGKEKIIDRFIKKHSLEKDEVIYIGDEYRDVMACKISNVKVIAVSWGFDSPDMLLKAGPDFIVESPQGIIKFLIPRAG
jgi:phosphoglycolate phosphatase